MTSWWYQRVPGVFLPDLCEARRGNPRRSMLTGMGTIKSSGAAPGAVNGGHEHKSDVAAAPASMPSPSVPA